MAAFASASAAAAGVAALTSLRLSRCGRGPCAASSAAAYPKLKLAEGRGRGLDDRGAENVSVPFELMRRVGLLPKLKLGAAAPLPLLLLLPLPPSSLPLAFEFKLKLAPRQSSGASPSAHTHIIEEESANPG